MTTFNATWTTPKASYKYDGFPIGSTTWNSVGGNYVFAKKSGSTWLALYAGQTEDFKARFANHEKLQPAKNLGATHIFARVNNNAFARTTEEMDFVSYFKPILNEKLK